MPVRYALDPGQSRFTVQAFARGLLSAFAHNPTIAIRDFTGEVQFDPAAPGEAAVQMTVRADSLAVIDNVPERDRPEVERQMRGDVLEVAAYPEVRFRGKAVQAGRVADDWYRLRLSGPLFLRGVTKTQEVDTQLRLLDGEARLSGAFTLSQPAYGIKRVSAVGGMVTLQDELKFAFDIVGRKVDS
jgi:polyisoprenoid-binding protein YceI